MKRLLIILMAACLLLSGCAFWMDGSHVTVTDHEEQNSDNSASTLAAKNYFQLTMVLEELIRDGLEKGIVNVSEYDQSRLEDGISKAVEYICREFPLGAYAVEEMKYEIGTNGGQPAISLDISYIHGRSEIRRVMEIEDMTHAVEQIHQTLNSCSEGVVLMVTNYREMDLTQVVEDYATEHPELVMETPQVALGIYPESGNSRILEVKFVYQTSRDVLRQMQSRVQRAFASAAYYLDPQSSDVEKFTQLYSFLMERNSNTVETSITPSYSLLIHGVGDSKATAMVYAAMCTQAELECQIVSGTRDGVSWHWNRICCDGEYYYVDLLRCGENEELRYLPAEEMQGYVWDYSAFPAE